MPTCTMPYVPSESTNRPGTRTTHWRYCAKERAPQFDPEMIEVFMSCLDTIHQIKDRYPDEQETGEQDPKTPGSVI